ncbi:secretory subunit [Pseudocyphellaria aurata]|nr:secretory subunit [Pseudocyphellaria aurata]
MATDYAYDEKGQFFPFFILTISGLVTFPLTYSLLKPSKELENTAPRIKSAFKPRDEDLIQGQKRKQWRRERRLKRIITVIVGYVMMAWMIYLIIVTARTVPQIWDPYNILEISRSASEQQIKRRYKELSLRYHPDKARPDESKNLTVEGINDYWVELSKAYKALTDEEVRNNFIQYGHPDGKQSFSIGIALPKFIITDGNGKYVLLVYGLLLGVLLPYVVGKWWYGTQRMTREKVLLASAGNLFKEYKEDITDGGILTALSSGEEYKDLLKGNKVDSGLGKIEKAIVDESDVGSSAAGLSSKDRESLEGLEGARRKALALLWAYLGRVRLDGSTLDDEKYEAAPLALALNESFLAIALAFGSVPPILSAYRASQHLIQAVPPNSFPLLQLPHITPSIAKAIEGPNPRGHLTIQQFMEMPEYQRRKLATDQRNVLTPSQYNDAVALARQLPLLSVEKAFFKVMGEKFITTGSLVQLVVKVRVIPPGSANVPDVNELDLEDVDPDEGDLDALLGRKAQNKKAKIPDGDSPPGASDEKPLQPPLAYAPYFARDHSPRWHVFLADSKLGKIAVPPFTFTTFNKPVLDNAGKPTFNMQTFKMQFQAPPQAGKYPFVMHLICDSYIGMDSKRDVLLNVEDIAKAAEMNDDDEISEPDEDSIAGQMNALKTGGLAGAPPKRKKKASAESSEDESDTEGEAASDTSETNTDTDTDGE